jgi:hypothetical protein
MKKIIFLLIPLTLFFSSCDDALDLNPIGSTSQDNFYKTPADANAAIIACYNTLIGFHTGDRRVSGVDMWGDTRSSDAEPHPDGIAWNQIYRYTLQPDNGEVQAQWFLIYQGIYRANQALEKIPAIAMDEQLKARLLKEALFLRAWWIFRLAKLYGSAPLVTTTLSVDELYVPKASQQELFDQVEKDLLEAESLPDSYDDANLGRATSAAAKTVLAELYMWQKRWPEAEARLASVVNSGRYGLLDSYSSLFDGTTENTKEIIFEVQMKANTGNNLGNFSTTYSAPNGEGYVPGGGWGWFRPTQDLVNEYETIPKEDPRLTYSIFRLGDNFEGQIFKDVVNGTGFAQKKWVISGKNGAEIEQVYPWHTSANFALYRYAEVLLLYAEVLNELGRPGDAVAYVNQVRARPSVAMPALADNLSQAQVFEAIRHERRVELSFEGKIGFDLRRWGIAGTFLRSPQRWQNNTTINPQWGGAFFKHVDGKDDYWPIPQSEIDKSNGTLVQNPGW